MIEEYGEWREERRNVIFMGQFKHEILTETETDDYRQRFKLSFWKSAARKSSFLFFFIS